MEGVPSGRKGALKVEREFEPYRQEGHLLAGAYEALVPIARREIVRAERQEVVTEPRRAGVGA